MDFTRLGPYQIGQQIGRGGMGTVYSAIEVDSGRQAAVKVLSPALAEREGFRERFEAEIESLKQLDHPNIVKLFGYGRQDQFLFYGMELVDGATLEDELRANRPFNWREVADIGIMLCRALKLAHDHGIVHRDIKPANLLVTREGAVKLSDFGIARLFGNISLTSEGGVIGTAEYMAPEQADGRRVTHHCDLYSLGCVLYALLAGRPPFKAQSMVEMLHMQRYSEPESVRRFAHDTPKEFDSIIKQLLAKEPSERFANALMVCRRLESMEQALTQPVRREPSGDDVSETAYTPSIEPKIQNDSDASSDAEAIDGTLVPADSLASGSPSGVLDESSRHHQETAVAVGDGDSPEEKESSFQIGYSPEIFTSIEEERQRALARERVAHPMVSLPTAMLILALLLSGAAMWYFLQPASADRLYATISDAASQDNPAAIMNVESEIEEFLSYYPQHENASEVREVEARINQYRSSRSATLRARRLIQRHPENAAGRAYAEAMNLAEVDTARAILKLEALITLYGAVPEEALPHKPDRVVNQLIVTDAKQQLARLQSDQETYAAKQAEALTVSLKLADQLDAEQPEQAAAIRRAAIELYGNKPWAAKLIDRARRALNESS